MPGASLQAGPWRRRWHSGALSMELAVAVRPCWPVAGPQIAQQLFATSLSCFDTSLPAVTGGQRLLPAGTQRAPEAP